MEPLARKRERHRENDGKVVTDVDSARDNPERERERKNKREIVVKGATAGEAASPTPVP